MKSPVTLLLDWVSKLSPAHRIRKYIERQVIPRLILSSPKASPQRLYGYAHDILKERWPEAEPIIATEARWAYFYAHNIIQGQWPEAEETIAQDAKSAYDYAVLLRGLVRWPEAEKSIAKDAAMAYNYAKNVIQGRWPEAEETIATNGYHALAYARDVIQGRWPEAEETIAQYDDCACMYAIDVIKGRWLEVEEDIATGFCKSAYATYFFPDEHVITKHQVDEFEWLRAGAEGYFAPASLFERKGSVLDVML